MAVIAHKIELVKDGLQPKRLESNSHVQAVVHPRPAVTIASDITLTKHPDYVEKPSEYFSHMLGISRSK